MTMRPAAPGPQLGGGRLRVDAARAIKKLREYQLADRSAWVLEAIRAAVASKATKVSLRGDANDIWLEWDGPPWDPALLPRLFDELVSPEPEAELQHARLLAQGINSALGMDPAYIDIYAITAANTAQRVRYTPEVLAEPENELGEAALRHVTVEAATPPSKLTSGMLVHLRRRFSLDVLKFWVGEPPELNVAVGHCGDLPIPITIGDHTFHRERTSDLVRVPLGEGLDGYIAVPEYPARNWPVFEVAERGVVLARYKLELLGYEARSIVPIRVFLDADRLPTNASRSQVRQDVHPISTAERRAAKLLDPLVEELAAKAKTSEPVRKAVLLLLASSVAGVPPQWDTVAEVLKPLANLPLLRNAYGQDRPVLTPWRGVVYTGKTQLHPDLAEWLGEIVWLPENSPERLLLGSERPDNRQMSQMVRAARRQHRAHKKFLAHAKRELRVQTSVPPRVRYELGVPVAGSCVPDSVFDSTNGEVCIYFEGTDAALDVLLEGRELERIELASAIPFDAVIDSSRIRPGDNYRGVRRDAGFQLVERAMRAAVVRAVEQLVVLTQQVSKGHFDLRGDPTVDHDRYLVRRAIELATSLGFEPSGPLLEVPAWPTASKTHVSFVDIRNARWVGLCSEGATLYAPEGRLILRGDMNEVSFARTLFGKRTVSYEPAANVAERISAAALLPGLGVVPGGVSLTLREGDLVGAIGLTLSPSVELRHMGKRVAKHGYNYRYLPVSVAVDSDRIVPNNEWSAAVEDAGLSGRDYSGWELELLRAMTLALIGERPAQFGGPPSVQLDDPNGRVLIQALTNHDVATVLGAEILAKLTAAPLFTLLGVPTPVSVDAIAKMFPHPIPYVEHAPTAVDDYHPLIAPEPIARLVGKLAKRGIVDARPALLERQKRLLFKERRAAHMLKPEQPVRIPEAQLSAGVKGVMTAGGEVAVGTGPFEIRVFVDNRPFYVLYPKQPIPIVAAVSVASFRCNDTFDAIGAPVADAIANEVLDAVPALLELIAKQRPEDFGSGPAFALLAAWVNNSPPLPETVRQTIFEAPAFMSIQGKRISLADAAHPRMVLQTATWADTWLGPDTGESETALDTPILSVSSPKDLLFDIVDALHEHAVADVTAEVGRLQARRRMARGLLPTPKLGSVPAELKRELKVFAEAKQLGHGEIGLVMYSHSSVLIHEQGQLKRTIDMDVQPAVQLAVEDPHDTYNFEQLRSVVQSLAVELLRQVLAAKVELPHSIMRSVGRAVLANRVPPVVVESLSLFQTTDGRWLRWAELRDQLTKYGDVWAVTSTHGVPGAPLDSGRLVFVLDPGDIDLAVRNGHAVINAKGELELDATARANQARPRATSLEILSREGMLAVKQLDGDGKSSPRGYVAVLDPASAERRGVIVHRNMHPFGRIDDVCKWPTFAVIDDARLTPDRTWSAPKNDDALQNVARHIRDLADELLMGLAEIPADALASKHIDNQAYSDSKAMRAVPDAMIRGVLYLQARPFTRSSITVHHSKRRFAFAVPDGMSLGGWLAIHAPDKLDLDAALTQLCELNHGKLVRTLHKSEYPDRDLVDAHVAHALALDTLKATEVGKRTYDCFVPEKLTARGLASLFRRKDTVALVKTASEVPEGETGFIDNAGELAKVIRAHLGERLAPPARPAPRRADPPIVQPMPTPPPPPATPPVSERRPPQEAPAKKPDKPKPEKAKPPHPLRELVVALSARVRELGVRSPQWVIGDEETEPVISFAHGQVRVAGDSPLLREVAVLLQTRSMQAPAALDALAAHAVSVLNIALTEITDANEQFALGVLVSPRSGGSQRSPS